jgi:hypothetical protein
LPTISDEFVDLPKKVAVLAVAAARNADPMKVAVEFETLTDA